MDIVTKAISKEFWHDKIEKNKYNIMIFPKIILKSINLKTKLFTCGF
jgi:hypothetical protein